MGDRFQLKGALAATWTSQNPILAAREPGVETDTNSLKVGDGETAWSSLDYLNKNLPGSITNFEVDASTEDQAITLPDATTALYSRLYIISGDFDTTFSTTGSQTIDGEATLVLKGENTLLIVPTDGDWRTFQGGGGGSGSTTFVTIDETSGVTLGQAVYASGVNTVSLADQAYALSSHAIGIATETGADTVEIEIQTAGVLEGLSGLTTGEVYYLGNDGDLVVEGSLPSTGYKQKIGTALSTTELLVSIGETFSSTYNDNAPLGVLSDFVGTTPPLGWEWVPYSVTTKLKSLYSQFFNNTLGGVDWFAPDASAASAASTAGTFHFPTIQDAYIRGGFHAAATFDNTDNSVTLLDQNGEAIDDDWADGTPIRFIGGTIPTGLTEYVTYYLGWDGVDAWNLYDTAANGETNDGSTGLTAFTTDGTGVTGTQFGITLLDQMQKITGESVFADAVRTFSASGALSESATTTSLGTSNGSLSGPRGLDFDSADSPNARTSSTTSGETRPRTGYMRKIIKVSNLLPTGEPVTAVKFDTGWVANSDWTNAEFTITHNLDENLSDLIVKFLVSSDGTEGNANQLLALTSSTANYGVSALNISSDSFKIQTGANGVIYSDDSGASQLLGAATAYYYKVVVYKPTILSSVVDIQWPVGAQYTQYASVASNDAAVALPASKAPAALFGGVWEKLWDTESVYFRTEGTDADDGRTDR